MIQGPDKINASDVKCIFDFKDYKRCVSEEKELSLRMRELYDVLEADYHYLSPNTGDVEYFALLGAMGRLFEILLYSEQKIGKLIFPFKFLNGLRSTLYYADKPFSQLSIVQQRIFFSVIYTYCQHELNKVLGKELYPSLSKAVDMSIVHKPYFIDVIDYAIAAGKPLHSKDKTVLLGKLAINWNKLNSVFQFFKDNPGYLMNDDSEASLQRANVVRSSVVATIMAWMSFDISILLKDPTLSKSENEQIVSRYQSYKKAGMEYRHRGLNLRSVPRQETIKAQSSAALQAQIDEVVRQCNIEKVKILLLRWQRHPSVMKSVWIEDPAIGNWLLRVAKRGNLQLVMYLHPRCPKNSDRVMAFVMAAQYGRKQIVQWYIRNGKLSLDLLKYALICATENKQHKVIHEIKIAMEQHENLRKVKTELQQLTQQFQGLMFSPSHNESQDSESLFSAPPFTIMHGYRSKPPSSIVIPGVSYAKVASAPPGQKYRM